MSAEFHQLVVAGDSPVAPPLTSSGQRRAILLGLILALALALGLTAWFYYQARDSMRVDRQVRGATITVMGIADLISAADSSDHQAILRQWQANADQLIGVRIVRLRGGRLTASTFDRDDPDSVPRAITEAEKSFYDQAQALRSAVQTNRDEGGFRKEQVLVERLSSQTLRISLPYGEGPVGMVQAELDATLPAASPNLSLLFGCAALALGLFALSRFWWAKRDADSPPPPGWRSRAALFATVALMVAVLIQGRVESGSLAPLTDAAMSGLSNVYQQTLSLRESLGERFTPGSAVGLFDVDVFQRPRGEIGANGGVDDSAVALRLAGTIQRLNKARLGNFALGLGMLAFFALAFARRLRFTLSEHRNAYGYVTPAAVGMLILVFFPFFYGIVLSFTEQTALTMAKPLSEVWVGLANFISIFSDVDVLQSSGDQWSINYDNFYWTLFITIMWTLCNVTLGVGVGMVLALALNTRDLRMRWLYRILLILPWAIPNYITALIWKGMFHPTFGVINQGIQMFGGEPVAWFDNVFSSFVTGVATNGWLSFPFMMVVILGGLQSISADMYEAAEVEGATRWQQFRHITLPSLKPTLVPAIIISVVWTFNMFNVIYLVSEGNPAGANEILVTQAYKLAFQKYQLGYAAAYSVVIFMILLAYGVFQTKVTRATEAVG